MGVLYEFDPTLPDFKRLCTRFLIGGGMGFGRFDCERRFWWFFFDEDEDEDEGERDNFIGLYFFYFCSNNNNLFSL